MESLLTRYRNLTVLLVVVVAQLLYLAYQVKTNRDERLIRVWAVTAVTPMAGVVEAVRHNTIGFLQDYFILLDVREQNRKLKADNDQLRMENVYYRNQLSTAEHARALTLFQSQTPSKTIAARVIAILDRRSKNGETRWGAILVDSRERASRWIWTTSRESTPRRFRNPYGSWLRRWRNWSNARGPPAASKTATAMRAGSCSRGTLRSRATSASSSA